MAEAMLRTYMGCGPTILSAGTAAVVEAPAQAHAVHVMRERGVDISTHRAQQATARLFSGCDVILTMDQSHQRWIDGNLPQFRGRAFKLLKWQDDGDVKDPYGSDLDAFERAYDTMMPGVKAWADYLAALPGYRKT